MIKPKCPPSLLSCMLMSGLVLTGDCRGLLPKGPPSPWVYALHDPRTTFPAIVPVAKPTAVPTLIINRLAATAGYDPRHIVYAQVAYRFQHFARSEWVAPPASMTR